MLFLWIFGNNVEDSMGRIRYLVFYLLAGVAAMALQTVVTLHWAGAEGASVPQQQVIRDFAKAPQGHQGPGCGASPGGDAPVEEEAGGAAEPELHPARLPG